MDKTPFWSVLLVAGCTLLLSFGQVLLKMSTTLEMSSLTSIVFNPYLVGGMIIYVGTALLITFALKHGDLSVLYPVIALGFVWVSFASVLFLGETFTVTKTLGTIGIILGVSFVGKGGRT